jgi:hypothetical protein
MNSKSRLLVTGYPVTIIKIPVLDPASHDHIQEREFSG